MKIKQSILDLVNKPAARNRIALDLGCGEQVIGVHMRQNKADGRLTKMDALSAIAKEVGKPVEEIIDEVLTIQN